MEKDENVNALSQVTCPHCKAVLEVKVLEVVRSEMIVCSSCKKDIDLSAFNEDEQTWKRKNAKELDKLSKLFQDKE